MRTLLAATAVLVSQVTIAATPINGWYGSLFGGFAYLPNNVSKTVNGLTRTEPVYHLGYDAGGSFGYKSNPLRYEAELTYVRAGLDAFRVNGLAQTGVAGFSSATLAMANVYYDFPELIPCIQPFLGVGLGYGFLNAKLNSSGPNGATNFSGANSVFAYQPIAGLTYNFAEEFGLALSYRYVGTERSERLGSVFQAHLFNAAFVYRFDGNRYK
jgi:opacity protein-like surface antigen